MAVILRNTPAICRMVVNPSRVMSCFHAIRDGDRWLPLKLAQRAAQNVQEFMREAIRLPQLKHRSPRLGNHPFGPRRGDMREKRSAG
jgi:hypothetical protein